MTMAAATTAVATAAAAAAATTVTTAAAATAELSRKVYCRCISHSVEILGGGGEARHVGCIEKARVKPPANHMAMVKNLSL